MKDRRRRRPLPRWRARVYASRAPRRRLNRTCASAFAWRFPVSFSHRSSSAPSASTYCGGGQRKRTATTLAATINEQIVSAVEKELDTITTQARAAHTAIRTLFVQNVLETREADKREFVFLSQLQSQPSISWVAFGWPDGAFFAAHKLGDLGLEMMEIAPVDGVIKRRVDKYQVVVGDIQFEKRRFENTDYVVTDQEWYKKGIASDEPRWFEVTVHPVGVRPSIAYAGPIDVYQKRQGVLAVIIENTRLAQFLSQLSVGKTGAAFILGRDGSDDRRARSGRRRSQHAARGSAAVADRAGRDQTAGGSDESDKKIARQVRFVAGGDAYAVTLTPLAFPGWTLATVIPEAEFLGPIETTIRHLLIGLAILILAAGVLSAWLARRVIATAADRGGRRAQARRALRTRPGAAAPLAHRRTGKSVKRHRRHGGRAWRRFANTSLRTW